MPSALEFEINSLLREHQDARKVADELVRRWRHQLFNEDEQFDCAQFLLATSQYSMLFDQIRRLIDEGGRLPWAQFADALGRAGVKPDDYEVDAMFSAAAQQNSLEELVRSRQLDLYSRAFGQRRGEIHIRKERALGDRKQILLDKIQFMRSQRMFEQELELLDEMQALFPSESGDVEREKETLRLRWAREVVSNARSTPASETSLEFEAKLDTLSPAMENSKKLLVERIMEIAKNKPALAYDLAMGLQMMDFHSEALEALGLAPVSVAVDWLKLELLVKARRFVTVLEEASRLEEQYASDPDAAFAATYARARALFGLGEEQTAIDLLRGLIKIRPYYRSAQSLLLDWAGGEA